MQEDFSSPKGKKKKLERRRNTNASRHRRKALKVNRKDALDCCVLLTRLDVEDVKNSPKNENDISGKVKPRRKHQPIQKAEEPKMNHPHAFLRLSPEPRRRRMASLNAEAVNSLLLFRDDPLSSRKTQLPKDNHKEHEPKVHKAKRKAKTQQDVGCKNVSVTQDQSIDWLSIFAPTPRRQAGLTAATLLKLTSAQYTNKRQKKREVTHETKCTAQSDTQRKPDDTIWTQHTRQKKTRGKRRLQGCSGSSAQTVQAELKNCAKAPLQHPPAPSFSPQVKEEQLEKQVSSCYCCTQEKCVQYCHRLSLFLRDKSFQGQDSVFHHHHHHHHLPALGTHSYTCFPGYYFHLCHPSDTSQEHVYPSSRKGTKLLGTQSSGASGISHPVYCCTSVEPCFDPCTVSSYRSYSSMIPAICHLGCTTCNHSVKKEEYLPAVRDLRSPPSLPMCPSPRVLTGCPISTVPPAGQSVHTPAQPSEPSQPAAPLRHNCAQSTKASRVSQVDSVVIRDRKHTPCASGVRSIINKWRHKSTNGWQPVGLPFQREVFTVGEEAPVLRICFEAVQRDGDVILVRDTVLLKSGPRKKSLPYVAKVSALWEDPDSGELMMSLFWYYRPEHTQGGHKPNVHCENEVFASRHQDVNSVACIEDKCYVLTLAQYCRFRALLKRQQEGVGCSAASVVPPPLERGLPTYHCVPPDMDPQLVFFCRHVYDFRYGRLLKNLH